jgi:integrase
MPTKRPPKTPCNLNKAVVFTTPSQRDIPMRGISYFERPNGTKRFFARWREEGRKKAQGFASPEARAKFARSLAAAREKIGRQALSFNADEWANYLRFKDVVGAVDPLTVAREWLAHRRGEFVGGTLVAEAIERYMRLSGSGDDKRVFYRKNLIVRERWGRFAGPVALRDVSAERVRDWLSALGRREGFTPVSIFNHRKLVAAFFNWCVRERLCERNPCDAVAAPKIHIAEVSVLPVADAQRLFAANAREPVAARLALEAFGGLRFSHAGRIERGEIDFARRGIILAADKHKSRRRGYLEGLPANLWEWLRAAPAETLVVFAGRYGAVVHG